MAEEMQVMSGSITAGEVRNLLSYQIRNVTFYFAIRSDPSELCFGLINQ